MEDKPLPQSSTEPDGNAHFRQMQQLTIYINETDHVEHKPLYLKILELVKQADGAGATVVKGLAGYSASSHAIHTSHLADIKQTLPLIIIIVDSEDKIKQIAPRLENMISLNGGLITVQDIEGHCYLHPHKNTVNSKR